MESTAASPATALESQPRAAEHCSWRWVRLLSFEVGGLECSHSWSRVNFWRICRWCRSTKKNTHIVALRQKAKAVCLASLFLSCLCIRATDQTPSHQRDPSGGIQSSVALCYPRQPQTRCHLAQRWWAYQGMHFCFLTFNTYKNNRNNNRRLMEVSLARAMFHWLSFS